MLQSNKTQNQTEENLDFWLDLLLKGAVILKLNSVFLKTIQICK